MDLIPDPNYDDPIFNLRVFKSGRRTTDKYLIKIDHNFKDGSNLNGSYNYGVYDNINPGLTEFAATNAYDYGKLWHWVIRELLGKDSRAIQSLIIPGAITGRNMLHPIKTTLLNTVFGWVSKNQM